MKVLATSLGIAVPLIAVMVFVALGGIPATSIKTQSCRVLPGGECSVNFVLRRSDQVSGSISIKGSSGGAANFWVTDPSGASIYDGGRVSGATSFFFLAGRPGTYVLHFNNIVSSLTAGPVTLNYNVVPGADC